MGKLIYKKMSLFDAPKGSVLVHACNAQGVWGNGIAKYMKQRFPHAFKHYTELCRDCEIEGGFDIKYDNEYYVASIITSKDFGPNVSSPELILLNTTTSLYNLCLELNNDDIIYSNKFNSGLFKVPWEDTEKIIKVFVDRYNLNWIVCDPNMEG